MQSKSIDFIVTSPYKRAIESILPLCNILGLRYTVDNRLEERVLSSKNLDNWKELLKETYENLENNCIGYEEWRKLTNPDIYLISKENQKYKVDRIWM